MELDRILEHERRQQSLQAFATKAESNYDSYLQGLDKPNPKNFSKGMAGVFGMGDTGASNNPGAANNYFPDIIWNENLKFPYKHWLLHHCLREFII